MSAYRASPPVSARNTAPMIASATCGRCTSSPSPASGLSAASTCGTRTIGTTPTTAITTNHTTMIGPKKLPTRAVPWRW